MAIKQANQPQADSYSLLHYTSEDDHGKTKRKDKDVAYYTAKGVPKKDAEILLTIMHRARKLDSGFNFLGFRMGWSSVIGLAFPVAGDLINAGLSSLLVIRKANQVSGGDDKRILEVCMLKNMFLGFAVGLTPYIGEIVDTILRLNTRSVKALEKMLLKRGTLAEETPRNYTAGNSFQRMLSEKLTDLKNEGERRGPCFTQKLNSTAAHVKKRNATSP